MESTSRLVFASPRNVQIEPVDIDEPRHGQVMVRSSYSAISSGTEMLVWQGRIPLGMELDSSIECLRKPFSYPCVYGYATVGRVVKVGMGIDPLLVGKRVFAFHPHQALFCSDITSVYPVPDDISDRDAVFLAQAETAVSLVQDAAPVIGERIEVWGLGVIGLLTALAVKGVPFLELMTWDTSPTRRAFAEKQGLRSADPSVGPYVESPFFPAGADCAFELTGNPKAFNGALKHLGFEARLIVGSWYGTKEAVFDLGSWFHRSRISIRSSQVSNIGPNLSARWTKERRMETAWQLVRNSKPSLWISDCFTLSEAAGAYSLVEKGPEASMQVILEYGESNSV